MNKTALLLTAVLAAGVVTMNVADNPVEDVVKQMEDDRIVTEKHANYFTFKHQLQAAIDALKSRAISLPEAHTRVGFAARQFQPVYLEYLVHTEPGTTTEERLANNLVGHVRAELIDKPGGAERIAELADDLDAFLSKNHGEHGGNQR